MRVEEIEMIDKTMLDLGRTVIGAIYIDYPVYLIHLEFKKKNDDPMFFIDWSIVHFMEDQPKLDVMSTAKIIGMDYHLIRYRIRLLKEDGLIREDANGFKITSNGKQMFFNEIDDIPYINASADFLVDGKDITIMPEIFYEDKGYITFDKNSIYPRKILKGVNDIPVKNLIKKIEGMTNDRKRSVGLPADSKDFTTIDSPSQGLLRMFLVFSCDSNNMNYKDIVYGGKVVDIPSIKEVIKKSYFRDNFEFNYGYDSSGSRNLHEKVFNFSINGIKSFLAHVFYWNDVPDDWFAYEKGSTRRPLTVRLTLENFKLSWNRRKLIGCLNSGYNEYKEKNDFLFVRITVVSTDYKLNKLLELDKALEESKKAKNLSNIESIFSKYGRSYVRKGLIMLERLDYLEEIDNRRFLFKEGR